MRAIDDAVAAGIELGAEAELGAFTTEKALLNNGVNHASSSGRIFRITRVFLTCSRDTKESLCKIVSNATIQMPAQEKVTCVWIWKMRRKLKKMDTEPLILDLQKTVN